MSAKITGVFLFLCISFCLLTTVSAQEKFPVGVYSNLRAADTTNRYLDSIKNLGFNWIIHESRPNINETDLENKFNGIIPSNLYYDSLDAIHYYSSGYYSNWEAEESVPEGRIGMKHDCGYSIGSAWYSDTTRSDRYKLLVRGPNYYQDQRYKIWTNSGRIQYWIKIYLKRGTTFRGGDPLNIGRLLVTNWNDTVAAFDIPIQDVDPVNYVPITNYYYLTRAVPRGGSPDIQSSHMNKYNSPQSDTALVQFMIQWYGNYELYVDKIEVYDNDIWNRYIERPTYVISLIQNQVSTFSSWNQAKLKYFYSADEPSSIDNYVPYKTIRDIVTGYGGKPLITAFVPLYNRTNNFWGDTTLPRWINTAQPERLMFDFYPINKWCKDSTNISGIAEQLGYLREICRAANKYKPDNFFYAAQAHGYSLSSDENVFLRQPTPNEFRSASMLALAHGTRGLMYYSYYSTNSYDTVKKVKDTFLAS